MGLPRNNQLCPNKYNLQRNMTEAEKKLWFRFLSNYPINFVNQKIIGNYIVDFFCNKVRISIELDGSQHTSPAAKKYDQVRSTYLEMLEIKELRYPNSLLWSNFEGVCEDIHNEIQKRRNDLIRIPLVLVKKDVLRETSRKNNQQLQ